MKEVTIEQLKLAAARERKDRAEHARREEKANRGNARAARQARLLAQAELGYGSW